MIAKWVRCPSFAADHKRCAAGDALNQGDEKREGVMGRKERMQEKPKRRHTGGS